MLMFAVGAAAFLSDVISKKAVRTLMVPGESIPIIRNVFHITYVMNPGAAFGLFAYRTRYFILVTIAVVAAIVLFGRVLSRDNRWLQMSLGLQLGGALGNLADRLAVGMVTDFLDFRIWPVFNLADTAIVIGVALFAVEVLFGGRTRR